MDGKRFSAGIFGGLLLGLAIITIGTASAGYSGGLFGASLADKGQVSGTESVVSTHSATGTPSGVSGNGTGPTSVPTTRNTTTTSSTTTANPPPPSYVDFNKLLSPASGQSSPSRLNNISAQPVATNGIILAPVLVAFLLGAILYRSSTGRKKEKESEEQKT